MMSHYHAHHPERHDALSRLLERLERWPETTTSAILHDDDQTDGEQAPTDGGWMRLTRPVQEEDTTPEDPMEETPALIVEGTLEAVDEPTEQRAEPSGDGVVRPEGHHHHGKPLLLLGIGAMLTALVLGIILVLLPAWTMEMATVTILPTTTSLHMTTMVQVGAGLATLAIPHIPGRLLPTLMLSEAHTVATTGIGTQRAQAAQGSLTFYNAAPSPQTVLTGTVLTGGDGVQVVTDQAAVIPAASFPTDGVVSVSAHALLVGPAGNIAVHDLYGACCRENVFVVNAMAFSGGQVVRRFPMVTAHDLSRTAATLRSGLQESVQAALATQLAPSETLLIPVACTASVNSDHTVGAEASQVSVQLTQTCRGVVYRTLALQTFMMQQMSQQASIQLGTSDHLVEGSGSGMHLTMMQVSSAHGSQGSVTLQVQGQSTWGYQFNPAHLATLASRIAGLSVSEATALLVGDPGVQTVSLYVTGRDPTRVPSDPHAIHVVIVTLP